ncbi:IS66 family transposase [soil metagenome]
MYQLPKSRDLGVNTCDACLEKQREIDRLREELTRLRQQLNQRQRAALAAPFGSATPSSKIPLKPKTTPEYLEKRGGAQLGHAGHGRRAVTAATAERVITIAAAERCPQCGGTLITKGWDTRSVLEMQPVVVEPVQYRLQKKYCASCQRAVCATAPGVLSKSLFGNQLTAHVLTSHYLHGEPLGRISERLSLGIGALLEMAHRVAHPFHGVLKELRSEYRQAAVRHADETGWRTDGQSGYAWLFCTDSLSIFLFRRTRSSSVAKEVLGTDARSGVLVVDRYGGYNRAPCALQYCYAHLLRDVEDLEKEFPTEVEVAGFTATLISLLSQAMHLRRQPITDAAYYAQAREIKRQIILAIEADARHPGLRKLQDLFHDKAERLYHWVESRAVPAENNRAERELRPTVIGRKVSFGSQSEAGAKTRETWMTVLATLRKRVKHPQARLKEVLDALARDPGANVSQLLWMADTS